MLMTPPVASPHSKGRSPPQTDLREVAALITQSATIEGRRDGGRWNCTPEFEPVDNYPDQLS
jgi:hypothetical protein